MMIFLKATNMPLSFIGEFCSRRKITIIRDNQFSISRALEKSCCLLYCSGFALELLAILIVFTGKKCLL